MYIFSGLTGRILPVFMALVFFSMFIPATAFSQSTDKTLRIYLDCSGEMQRGGIMKTTAAVLAAELPKFYESKDIPTKLLILVDAFFIKSGQPLIESRFDFRIGQPGEAPYKNLRDFERPSKWWWEGVDEESDINSVVNREAWPGDVKNSNTILVILTNSRKSLDADDVIAINKSAEKIGSKIIQIILPRPNDDNTDEGLRIELNKTISRLLQTVKLEMQNIVAKFEATPVEGDAPLKVSFKNKSENATAFAWDFGNRERSDKQSPPELTYTKPGKYLVSLTAANGAKTHKFDLPIMVKAKEVDIIAKFEVQPDTGEVPLTVNFTNLSSNSAQKFEWNFGNRGTSTERNPSPVRYSTPGKFKITLTAFGENGKPSEPCNWEINAIEAGKPAKASFVANPLGGTAPLIVFFTDKSENALKLKWDFGDSGSKENFSEERNPKHTYTVSGDFRVTLKATGADGKVSDFPQTIRVTEPKPVITTPASVETLPKTVAKFSADPIKGKAPLDVKFQNSSENAASFQWNFGDDKKSTEKTPKHKFEKAGNYKVKLTATGEDGEDSTTKDITIEPSGSILSLIIPILIILAVAAGYFLFRFIFPSKALNVIYKKNRQPTENSPQKLKKSISLSAVFGCERNFKIFICFDSESDETKIQFFSLDDRPINLQSALDPNRTIALQKDTMTNPAKLGEYKILGTNDSFEVTTDSEEA